MAVDARIGRLLLALLATTAPLSAGVRLLPVHPAPDEFITPDELMVIVSAAPSADGELAPIKAADVLLDDEPVGAVLVSPTLVRWIPDSAALASERLYGAHSVTVVARDNQGTAVAETQWRFTVLRPGPAAPKPGKARRITQSGRVFTEAGQYSLGGETTWEVLAGGSYRGSYGKLRYGAEVLLTNLNDSHTQDRNVLRADVHYGRSLYLKVGDTRPSFHPAILSGKRIRGLEAGFHAFLPSGTNIANLDIAWGQARRAAEPDTYERNIFSARASFGSGRIFQFGLTFLKGRDDTSSVAPVRDTLLFVDSINTVGDTVFDTTFVDGSTPEDNLVVGADIVTRLLDRRLELYGSYAFSLYTRDIGDTVRLTREHLTRAFGEKFDFDPDMLGDLMILNTSSLPLAGGTGVLNSSHIAAGLRLHLPFTSVTEHFELAYKLQGANYHSMGSTLLGTGEQGFTVSNRLLLFFNRLVVDQSYGRYWNNLDALGQESTVTNRVSLSAGLFYSPRVPSLTLSYSYNGAANEDTTFGFDNDVNQLSLVSAYNYRLGLLSGSLQLYGAWSGITNGWHSVSFEDSGAIPKGDTASSFSTGVYGVNVQAHVDDVPMTLSGGISTNAGSEELLKLITGSVRMDYRFIPSLLAANAGIRIGATRMPDESSYSFHLRVPYGVNLTVRGKHRAVLRGYLVVDGSDFDMVNILRYEWRF
ncbi:MAG: hypothetical protein GF331_03085 [Chitinivibrionales bacterium]|nr:hypothetical protein [Chitinivibrionales bacterium]